jgi:hypothetical protein
VVDAGAGITDVCGTFVYLDALRFGSGLNIGCILDQTEIAHLGTIDLESTIGLWIVNGVDHLPYANGLPGQSNVIHMDGSCQVNGAIAIIDDGGTNHSFKSMNISGQPCYVTGAQNGCFENIYWEGSSGVSPFYLDFGAFFSRVEVGPSQNVCIKRSFLNTPNAPVVNARSSANSGTSSVGLTVEDCVIACNATACVVNYVNNSPNLNGLIWKRNINGYTIPLVDGPPNPAAIVESPNGQGIAVLAGNQPAGIVTAYSPSSPQTAFDTDSGFAARAYPLSSLVNGINSHLGCGGASYVEVSGPTLAFQISGFGDGVNGLEREVFNTTLAPMTLKHEDSSDEPYSSTAPSPPDYSPYRIYSPTGTDVICTSARLRYSSSFLPSNWSLSSPTMSSKGRWIVVSCEPTWSPLVMPGLALWLRADQGVSLSSSSVQSWSDLSGTGGGTGSAVVFTQYAGTGLTFNARDSTLGNQPSIANSSGNSSLYNAATYSQPDTIYVVCYYSSVSSTAGPIGSDTSSQRIEINSPDFAMAAANALTGTTADTNAHVHCCTFNGASSAYYLDSSATAIISGNVGAGSMAKPLIFENSQGFFMTGAIAEIIIFNQAHTQQQRQQVMQYLGQRYGQAWG